MKYCIKYPAVLLITHDEEIYGKTTIFGKFKTKLWNFLLPPHIRLKIK